MTEQDLTKGQTYELPYKVVKKMFPNVIFTKQEIPVLSSKTNGMLYVPVGEDELVKFKYEPK